MWKYKVSVTKNQKKYSIVLDAENETSARKKVHSEGYSILNVEEFSQENVSWHKFFFDAKDKNGITKKWQVVAKDPFKVYVKLKQWLWYDINFLYSENNKGLSDGEKMDLVAHLEEQYKLYISHTQKNQSETWNSKTDLKKSQKNLENFYMKKELEETYRLIDFVLIKLQNILDKADKSDINSEKREKLKHLNNSIVKLKTTTNINKLREVWELALKKIWAIELQVLEKYKDKDSKNLLKETNSLLKKLWSKDQFVEKDKDYNLKIKNFFSTVQGELSWLKKGKSKKKEEKRIDKESTSYWKTELLIKKYQERKQESTKNIVKNIAAFLFPFWKNDETKTLLLIRRKVINQNLTILKAKKTGRLISYTKVVKWYHAFVHFCVSFLQWFNWYLQVLIFSFWLLFGWYLWLHSYWFIESSIAPEWVFIFIYIVISSILIFFTRWFLSLCFNFALFMFLFIFGIVNFW